MGGQGAGGLAHATFEGGAATPPDLTWTYNAKRSAEKLKGWGLR